MDSLKLTANGIKGMVKSTIGQVIVQILSPKQMKTSNRISCMISDGHYKIKAFINQNQFISQTDNYTIIRIKVHSLLEQLGKPYAIVAHVCQIVYKYTQEIGHSIVYPRQQIPVEYKIEQALLIQKSKIINQKMKNANNSNKIDQKKQQSKNQKQQLKMQDQQQQQQKQKQQEINKQHLIQLKQTDDIKLDENQRITDLYVGLMNWQIVVVVTKNGYKQFISKLGKPTKVVNLQLMDSTGTKIKAAMFGQQAIKYHKTLKQQSVYQISRGKIKQDDYIQNKSANHSPYSLILTTDTQIKITKNQQIITVSAKRYQNLREVYVKQNGTENCDVVAILFSVQPEIQFQKNGKSMIRQTLEICDPINQIIMQVIIWYRKIKITQDMIGKTIALHQLKLNVFNQKVTLVSSYHTTIKMLNKHHYRQYQGKILREQMQFISERFAKKQQIQQKCTNLKQLNEQLEYLQEGKKVKSTLTLIMTLVNPRNWYYQACPSCRKAGQSKTKCQICQTPISETLPRYKISVEMSDYTGSIWATGFQEFGHKLFEDIPDGIQYLKSLSQQKRQQLFQKYQFRQYSVSLASKLDNYSQVKHTITKIMRPNLMENLKQNLRRINIHSPYK